MLLETEKKQWVDGLGTRSRGSGGTYPHLHAQNRGASLFRHRFGEKCKLMRRIITALNRLPNELARKM